MKQQPRKHHFIPQFYLAGFTSGGGTDADLWVLDQQRRRQWKSTPKKSAWKKDFHATDFGPDEDPMVIEKKLSVLEDRWAAVLRWVIQNQTVPEDESFADLMFFASFMAIRVPRIRNTVSEFINDVS